MGPVVFVPEAARLRGMLPATVVGRVSGHSTRVGATQDLAALDIDLAAITQAGGWKSPRMPLLYARRLTQRDRGWRGQRLRVDEANYRQSS
jgi:hypothetical protein